MEPAYTYYVPYVSNEEWQKQTQDSKYWSLLEKEQEKAINNVTSKSTSSEGKVYDRTGLQTTLAANRKSALDSVPNIKNVNVQPIPIPENIKAYSEKYHQDTLKKDSTSTPNLVNNFLLSIKDKGLWADYSGPDRTFRTVTGEGKDKKVTYDWKAGIENTIGNIANYGSLAMSFIKDKETANNSVNNTATSARKTAQLALLMSGQPYAMLGAAISMLSDKVGGTSSASKTGNFWTDAGNTAASFVPFLGFAGKKAGTFNELADVNASSMYANIGDVYGAREHSGGSFIFGGNDIKNKVEDSNKKAFIISNDILLPGKRDLASAMDNRWGVSAEFDLKGGMDRVNNFGVNVAKQGAVLQFTKRTLSKHKIKKLQDGGKVQLGRTLDELVDYVEQQNPPFWKRMSGLDMNNVWIPEENMPGSLRMSWSTDSNGNAIVYPEIQYDGAGNLVFIRDRELAFKNALKNNDYVIMTPAEAKLFTEHYKESKKLKPFYDAINSGNYLGFYKDGGKVNVIPEGALHKNKHHLEEVDEKFEDVTTKGIPVIVESEDGEVIQLAEVEREEIIFRLEVTKKLEELSKKHTDEAAIEAGKLLTYEILYNTEDKTNNMI